MQPKQSSEGSATPPNQGGSGHKPGEPMPEIKGQPPVTQAVLLEAVGKAAEWFAEYAQQHEAKAGAALFEEEEQNRLTKAKTNQDRADYFNRVLLGGKTLQAQPALEALKAAYTEGAWQGSYCRDGEQSDAFIEQDWLNSETRKKALENGGSQP